MPAHAVPPLLQHVRRLAGTTSSDEQLLADFLDRRSDEAFAALLARHGPMVLNVCRRILHDPHAAEDVFQSTFLVLARRAAAIRRRASLAGFLHGVAYRLAVRARKRETQPSAARMRQLVSGLIHSTASNGDSHAFQRSSGFGESGCATIPNPPSRRTSSTTSRASPARGYGEAGMSSAT